MSNAAKSATPFLPLDFIEAHAFLKRLDPTAETFTFQTFDDHKTRRDKRLVSVIHGTLEASWETLARLNQRGAGIFVTINRTDGKRRTIANITDVRAVWAELDEGWPESLPLEPSVVVESSPDRWHAYWLADGMSAEDHAGVMARLVSDYGSDPNAADLARVLRLPGFYNRKRTPHLVLADEETGRRFSRDEILRAFPPLPAAPAASPEPTRDKVNVEAVKSALDHVPADDRGVWLKVGQALKWEFGESGFGLWSDWSQQSEKYDPEDQDRVWASIRREAADGKVTTAGTIFKLALDNGWKGLQTDPHGEFEPLDPDLVAKLEKPKPATPATITATPYVWADPEGIPPRDWIFGKHMVRKFVSATIAPGGVGKSLLIIAEALSIVTGRALLSDYAPRPGRVWLYNGEDPYDELQRRIQAACLHYRISREEIEGRLFVDSGRQMPIVIATEDRSGANIAVPVVDAVKATLLAHKIDVLMIDPFVSTHRVSENDNNKIEAVAWEWAKIADACDCAIELVHHSRKTGGNEVTAEHSRGASALLGKARSVRVLNGMDSDYGAKAGVENHRLYFRVDNGKANMAPPSDAADWYRLEGVPLGNGTGERPQDEIGVVVPWTPPAIDDGLPEDAPAKAQAAIAEGQWRLSHQSGHWAGIPIGKAFGWDAENQPHRNQLMKLIAAWIREGAFEIYKAQGRDYKVKDFVRPVVSATPPPPQN